MRNKMKKSELRLLLFIAMLMTVDCTYAQKQSSIFEITGKVVDINDNPIAGASLVESGLLTNEVVTNIEGEFSLVAIRNSVLEISFCGYVPKQLNVMHGKENIM